MLSIHRRRPGSFHQEALVASEVNLSTSDTYARQNKEKSLLQADQSGSRAASSAPDMAGQTTLRMVDGVDFPTIIGNLWELHHAFYA